MSRSVVLFAFCFVLFSACDSAELMQSPDDVRLRQFVVGDTWLMNRTDSLYSGGIHTSAETITVSHSQTLAGETWFFLSGSHPFGGADHDQTWLTVRDDGLWKRTIEEGVASDPWMLLPFPLNVGEQWSSESGLIVSRSKDSETVQIAPSSQVESFELEVRSTEAFRPFSRATGALSAYRDFPLDRLVEWEHHLSPQIGFVQLGGAFLSPRPDRVTVVGEFRLELVEFIAGD